MNIAIATAIGRRDYAKAIALLRADLSTKPEDAATLALIAQCHARLGEADEALRNVHEALQRDPDCFAAHRVLASLHAERQEHAQGLLHARNALRTAVPLPPMPVWVRWMAWLVSTVVLLRRGSTAAAAFRQRVASVGRESDPWLEWAREYVAWGDARGTLKASNSFRAPPTHPQDLH